MTQEESKCARGCPLNSLPRGSWVYWTLREWLPSMHGLPPITAFTVLTDIAEDEQVRAGELRGISAVCVHFKTVQLSCRREWTDIAVHPFSHIRIYVFFGRV